jgi:hypothetical protein
MSQIKLPIDWNRFDGYSFQEMCNHLLVAENIIVVPLRAGPYADRGQDAVLFEGTMGDLSGKIVFQAKYRQPKSGAANFSALKTDLKGTNKKKGELDKAQELQANHLIVMTNVQLTVPQQEILLSLAEAKPFRLHIWDEEKIKALLVNHPYIRFFHINGPEYPMFVPPEHFFEKFLREDSGEILSHLPVLVGRDKELDEFRTFLFSKKSLLTIFAPPGQGKSRLMLEFSRLAQNESDWIPLMLRADGKLLKDHLEELNPQLKYLILIDDAHQYYNRLKEFLTLLNFGAEIPRIKLVFASRTSFSGLVRETFTEIQPFELIEIIIHGLSQEIILSILKKELPFLNEVQLRDLLPFVKDSPLLAIATTRLLKLGKPLSEILTPGHLRNLLFEFPLADLSKYCSQTGDSLDLYNKLLTLTSAIQPISLGNERLIELMCNYLNIKKNTFIDKIDKLIQFGFLRKYGLRVRINPEILSDIILEKDLLTSDGHSNSLGEELAEYFYNFCLEELLDNLSDVGQISFKGRAANILGKVFRIIEKNAKEADNINRSELVKKLKPIGNRRADNVISIIKVMIDNPKDNRIWEHSGLLGEISSLLGIVAHNYEYIDDALELLKNNLLKETVETSYVNYKPEEVIKKIMGYDIGKPIIYQERALETLFNWKGQGEQSYIIAIHSLSPIFNRSISYTRSSGASITLGNVTFSPTPEVISLREKALDFLLEAINSGAEAIQLAAIKTVSEIGGAGAGPTPGETTSLKTVIEQERLSVIDVFEHLLSSGDQLSFLLTAKIEELLWHWWWSKTEIVARRCLELLKLINRKVEYELFKYLYLPQPYIFPNLSKAANQNTNRKRKDFFLDIKREERQLKQDFIEKIIGMVGHLKDFEYWANLLDSFSKETENQEQKWQYGIFMAALARSDPELGECFYKEKKGRAWEYYGPALLSGIREVDEDWWISHIKFLLTSNDVCEETGIIDSIYALPRGNYHPVEIDFLKEFSLNGTENIREAIAASPLFSVSRSSWYLTEEIVRRLIKNPCSPKALDEICSALVHDRPIDLGKEPTETEKEVLFLLEELEDIDGSWYGSFIAKFANESPKILFDFARQREVKGKNLFGLERVFGKVAPEWKKRSDLLELVAELGSWVTQSWGLSDLGGEALKLLFDDDSWKNLEASINSEDPLSIIKAAGVAANFPKDEKFYDFFVMLLGIAQANGMEVFRKVSNQFFNDLIWKGDQSRKIGEPSPHLLEIKSQCKRILRLKALSREIRDVFKKCLTNVDREIEQEKLRDEELLGD